MTWRIHTRAPTPQFSFSAAPLATSLTDSVWPVRWDIYLFNRNSIGYYCWFAQWCLNIQLLSLGIVLILIVCISSFIQYANTVLFNRPYRWHGNWAVCWDDGRKYRHGAFSIMADINWQHHAIVAKGTTYTVPNRLRSESRCRPRPARMYCIVLYCIVLYCIVLYCTV